MANPLNGEGKRPGDPYVRIVWAANRGKGCTLTAAEVWEMRFDAAIETRANNTVHKVEFEP